MIRIIMEPTQNPYNFITDPSRMSQPTNRFANKSPKQRLLVGIVFIAVVLLLAFVGFSLLFGSGKADNSDLIVLRAHQVEIDRVAELGLKSSTNTSTRNTVATLQASILSDQGRLAGYMTDKGVKVDPKLLGSKKNTDIDEELETAKQRNTYDTELLAALKQLATDYDRDLGSAIKDSTSAKEKKLLEEARASLTVIFASE